VWMRCSTLEYVAHNYILHKVLKYESRKKAPRLWTLPKRLHEKNRKKYKPLLFNRILQKIINIALQIILDDIGLFSLKVAGYNYISKPLYRTCFSITFFPTLNGDRLCYIPKDAEPVEY